MSIWNVISLSLITLIICFKATVSRLCTPQRSVYSPPANSTHSSGIISYSIRYGEMHDSVYKSCITGALSGGANSLISYYSNLSVVGLYNRKG